MRFLVLRLEGPMQSWSPSSRFTTRTAGSFPTQSAIFGILASAMGYERDNSEGLKRLEGLATAVRIDQAGTVMRDYHTVEIEKERKAVEAKNGQKKIDFKKEQKKITNRMYLQDAKFVVLLYCPDGEDRILDDLAIALKSPENPIFLGRKTCVPSQRVLWGMRISESLVDVLADIPYLGDKRYAGKEENTKAESWIPGTTGKDETLVADVPLSFDSKNREYSSRVISKIYVELKNPFVKKAHDPFDLLEG